MGKWVKNAVTVLVLLALTSFLGELLKGPIDNLVSQSRLKAQIQLAPWIAKPKKALPLKKKASGNRTEAEIKYEAYQELLQEIGSRGSSGLYGVARVNLENTGNGTVTKINFRLDRPDEKHEVLVIDSKGQSYDLGEVGRVMIPDMDPGDRVTVYMWGTYSSHLFPDYFRSYSSAGPFRTSFDWPQTQEYKYESSISRFIDEYADTALFIIFGALMTIFIFLTIAYDGYVKDLFKNSEKYSNELSRFNENPEIFQPNFAEKTVMETKPEKPEENPTAESDQI